jgi:hypothetical protein
MSGSLAVPCRAPSRSQLIAAGLGVAQGLQRRRRRGQDHLGFLDLGAGHGQVAALVDEALLLLEGAVVLLIHHDQLQAREGQE